MIRGRSSIMIYQPVEVVFAMLPRIGTTPGAAYSSIQQIPEGSVGIGTIFVQKASGLTNLSEVTEYAPYQLLTLRTQTSGWMHGIATGTYTFESIAEGTLLTVAMEMRAFGWFWPILEFFRFSTLADSALQFSLNALKSRIETEALLPGTYHISGPLPPSHIRQLLPEEMEG